MINVTIVYGLPEKQFLLNVNIKDKTTVKDAIIASGILSLQNEINLKINKIGINNQLVQLTDKIKNGDRIEIYRPIIFNPRDFFNKTLKKQKK